MTDTPYEWDDAKRDANLRKHGVDFAAIDAFDWDTAVIYSDTRHDEPRWVAVGFIGDRLHVVTCTERAPRLRIISLRKANRREEARHAQEHAR